MNLSLTRAEHDQLLRLVGHHARAVVRDLRLPVGSLLPTVALCGVCSTPIEATYSKCYKCNGNAGQFHDQLADVVVPLSYAVKSNGDLQQFYSDLYRYKGENPSEPAKNRLRALLYLFRAHHFDCLEMAAGKAVDLVIAVPSGRGRTNHPLPGIAHDLGLPVVSARFVGTTGSRARRVAPSDFEIPTRLYGHVVILEDTWVTGANAQSLAIQAKAAGAEHVSVVVLARLLDYGYETTRQLVDSWPPGLTWSPDPCPVLGVNCTQNRA